MKQSYTKVSILYEWSKKLKGFIVNNEYEKIRSNLLKECILLKDASTKVLNVFNEKYCFPSEASKKIAEKDLKFSEQEFSLLELTTYIHKNMENLGKDNIVNIILMLSDIALYQAYCIIEKISYGGLYFQLNMCIILDAMKIKPDSNIDVSFILNEVSRKAAMNIDMLDKKIIWSIAMLNYKMHVYNMAILFFDKYLANTELDNDIDINEKRINAKIYIGYCYEKKKDFSIAINKFEELLQELKNNDDKHNIIIELHHGLGHFYNERAIFEDAETKDQDILKARLYMKKALAENVDYSSCYGSLYHEYGDYENAQMIYEESSKKEKIKNNEELAKELQFYIGQTYSAIGEEQHERITEAERNLNEFEKYCERTFNTDGIVHARIFKIRTELRNIDFTDFNKRNINRDKIKKWYKELKDKELSNYASEEIKSEYRKTICILNIFRVLYADDNFAWHKEDILYYLKEFIQSMPVNMRKLDYSEEENTVEGFSGNLYIIWLDGLWIWCAGGKSLKELLEKEKLKASIQANGIKEIKVVPVKNREQAHQRIHGNGKPDLVVLIPPQEKDSDFENEVKAIKSIVSESYFFFSKEISKAYDSSWFQEVTQGRQQYRYSDIINHIIPFAYCFRALEILRKELLQPIPLFSLAPTHFSSSYDFQLGEELEILPEAFDGIRDNAEQKKIRKLLEFVDYKYSSSLLGRRFVNIATTSLEEICCRDDGTLVVCLPRPEDITGQDDNYISYIVKDTSSFDNSMFIYELRKGIAYTVKALSSYKNYFWDLEGSINDCAKECEIQDKHVCCNVSLLDNSEISNNCKKLLQIIFGEGTKDLSCQCKCILRKIKGNEIIYMVLETLKGDCVINQNVEKERKDMHPTVFVTYSWEDPNNENLTLDYLKEVRDFVNTLRDNGYEATFDRDMYQHNHNWSEIMIEGLKMDKVVVLLSKEYKRKADDCYNRTGVAFERNVLIQRLKRDRKSVIFAKLPSQGQFSPDEISPICFSGENVIDLASPIRVVNGYDLLFSTLSNNPITRKLHDVNKKTNLGKTI